MTFLAYGVVGLSVFLQVALVVLILKGHHRRYNILLAYCVLQLLIIAAQDGALYFSGVRSALYSNAYWVGEVISYLSLFIMVILMTDRILEGSPLRPKASRILLIVTLGATILPFILYHPYFNSRWYRHVCQLLSFGGAIMNLVLWAALIATRNRDRQLMKVSAGLGIAVTGFAIAYGVPQFFHNLGWLVELLKSVTLLAMLTIWCWAFRQVPHTASRAGQPLAGNTPSP